MIRHDDLHNPTPRQINTSGMFDVDAAKKERIAARIGGMAMTERAAGVDEGMRRDVEAEVRRQKVLDGFRKEFEDR